MDSKVIIVDGLKYPLMNDLMPFEANINAKISKTNFHRNVFIMIKYRSSNAGLRQYILDSLEREGFKGVIANDPKWNLTNNILNPLAVLYCCKYGLAIFDGPEKGQTYNPNVAYELGIMHYQHKKCKIFVNKEILPKKPFDLLFHLHNEYEDSLEIKGLISDWIQEIKVEEDLFQDNISTKIGVAIVRKANKYLITKRRQKEGNLEWSFPAKRLRSNSDGAKSVVKECFDETGIKAKVTYKIGTRMHPENGKTIEYYSCKYVGGVRTIKDKDELIDVQWVSGKRALELITTDIYEPVKNILLGR